MSPRSVIAQSPDAIVTQDGFGGPYQDISPGEAFLGCLLATGREHLLIRYDVENPDLEQGATSAATAGHYAALATFQTDQHYGGSSNKLTVYDLQTGKLRNDLGGESQSGCDAPSCLTSMEEIAINARGFTAAHTTLLTFGGPFPTPPVAYEAIQVSDNAGPRTVDTATSSGGPTVLTNLALSGNTLTWKHAGVQRSVQRH